MKRLLAESPQDILDWVLQGAAFTGNRSHEFDSVMIEADEIHEAMYMDKLIMIHLEFQSGPDADMQQRLLEYSTLAYRYYERPICSVVIYLRKGGEVATSPLIRTLPDGEEFLRFHFRVIQLYEIPYEELMEKDLPGLLPLVPLAKGGAKREVIEQIIARLSPQEGPARKELLALTRLFASLALKSLVDQIWLRRRFEMLKDILRETPAYQEILEEGREEGLEKGLREGLEEGLAKGREQERQRRLQSLRQKLLEIVQTRFPRLKTTAKGLVAVIEQPDRLEDLLIRVASASTTDEAREAFITATEQVDREEMEQ